MVLEIKFECKISEIERLEKMCFPKSAYSLPQLENMFSQKKLYNIISIFCGNKCVGYAILFDNSECVEIMKIGILPEWRKNGLGTKLLEEIKGLGKDIFLEVRESNIVAQNFYMSNGFIEVGKRKNYYQDTGETAIIMKNK